jgi:anti-anti-sigma factor
MGKDYTLRMVVDHERQVVLVAKGELDLTAAAALRHCLDGHHDGDLVIDLADVTFLDSTIIGVLAAAQNRHLNDGGPLRLRNVQPAQMKVFDIAGVVDHLRAEPA